MLNDQRAGPPFLSIICTSCNEGSHIFATLNELAIVLRGLPYRCELIVFNDGSTDNTAEEIGRFVAQERVRRINYQENRGFGHCLKRGIELAAGERVMWFPTHGMVDPHSFLAKAGSATDDELVVFKIENPYVRPFWRVWPSWLYVRLVNFMLGLDVPAYNVCVVFPTATMKSLRFDSDRSFILVEMVAVALREGGLRWRASTMRVRRRRDSRSKSFTLPNVKEIARNLWNLRARLRALSGPSPASATARETRQAHLPD